MSDNASQSRAADLSVMIPCKNNERTIGRVLESVRGLASQLVVIDSGSTDATMDLVNACRQWSGKDRCEVVLIQTHWRGYVRTKQLGMQACSHTYTLCLDSDEPLTPELAASLRDAIAQGIDAAKLRRMVEYRGKLLRHAWQPEHRLRFVRTQLVHEGRAWSGGVEPHDSVELEQGIEARVLDGILIHEAFESFADQLSSQLDLAKISAQTLHASGVRSSAWKLMTSPPGAFLKQLVLKQAFRDGYAGWLAAAASATHAACKHMMLYELGNKE
ncbi:MAG: glycosyltransferase family 2 protein [Phycisphaerales bacterium]|nr:glycosyltransferase family 2 protein [Phycisphaerales bacterium]